MFSSGDDLFQHLADIHADLKGITRCKKCLNVYKYHSMYLHHACGKSVARPFACTMCSATFFKTSRLHLHYKRMHHKVRTAHTCQYCPMHGGFMSQLDLLRHHNEEHAASLKIVACLTCGKKMCGSEHALHNHIKCHDTSANFACCFCVAMFANEEDYKQHQVENDHAPPPNGECVVLWLQYLKYQLPVIAKLSDCDVFFY